MTTDVDQELKDPSEPVSVSPPPSVLASGSGWDLVAFSGLVCGAVMAISRAKLDGAFWLFPTGLAYQFCIQNSSFRFTFAQKFIAIVFMLVVGTYWREILDLGLRSK